MKKESKIFVAGHRGMVGSALMRNLQSKGFQNIVTRTSKELDLRNQASVSHFFKTERPEYVFLAAAKVGGILANNIYRADFLVDNLAIELNVIQESYLNKVSKLLFLGSSCIYPKIAPQPLKEEYLLCNYLEETNEPYAIAKIAGLKMCENYHRQYGCNFIAVMPANLYGPNDNYDLQNSHVLPALIRKLHEAKINNEPKVEVWGSGKPKREFLHVDDLAEACFFLMMNYNEQQFINAGFGDDVTILELAEIIKEIVGFKGALAFNSEKPDGTPRKLLDSGRINNLGWKPKINLSAGIAATYESYIKQAETV
ncbi:MAG: GDP-L-fucose synthase [Bacteroidota bacterium]